ncbi:hypothetical protein [Novosphingobium sp. 18052]|nr:hypothetical protein [Novosphingobium sp. 18052]
MVFFSSGTKAPTEKQLRRGMQLPHTSKFLGWAIHTPHEDGFLLKSYDSDGSAVKIFGGSPEKAAKYKNPNVAARIADELPYPAVLTALFDLGNEIASIAVGGNVRSAFAPSH